MSSNKEILKLLGKAYNLIEEQKYDAIDQAEYAAENPADDDDS